MKKRGVPSPDLGDAAALTFAGGGGDIVRAYNSGITHRFVPRRRDRAGLGWLAN